MDARQLLQLERRVIDQCPFQAYEFKLAHIRPVASRFPMGQWSQQTIDQYSAKVMGQSMEVSIYSIVDNVIRCDDMVDKTLENPKREEPVRVVRELLNHHMAEPCEEPMTSRLKHDERERERSRRLSLNLVEDGAKGFAQEDEDENNNTTNSNNESFDSRTQLPRSKGRSRVPRDNDWQVFTPEAAVGSHRGPGDRGMQRGSRRSYQPIRLHGPSNPLMISFSSLGSTTSLKSCTVMQDSVNSICLDEHPGNPHDQLLVAASVGMHASGNRLMPRDTTLMPMVPGLAHIVPMIFAPLVREGGF